MLSAKKENDVSIIGMVLQLRNALCLVRCKNTPGSFLLVLFIFVLHFYPQLAWSQRGVLSEEQVYAAQDMGNKIANWINEQPKLATPMAIFAVRLNSPLNVETTSLFEAAIVQAIGALPQAPEIKSCLECRSPEIELKGDTLIVTKGIPNLDVLRELGAKYQVNAFLDVTLNQTHWNLVGDIRLFSVNDGKVISSTTIIAPAMRIMGSAFKFNLAIGSGAQIGGEDRDDMAPPILGSFRLMERLGSRRFGVEVFGGGGNGDYLASASGILGFGGSFKSSYFQDMAFTSVGYGVTEDTSGIVVGIGYDLFYGSFLGFGPELKFIVPLSRKDKEDNLNGFLALSLIFNLGN